MQRVLQVVNIMDRGGIETLLMNIYRHIDRRWMQFDFLTHPYGTNYVQEYERDIRALGGKVYKAPSFAHEPMQYTKFIREFFSDHPEYSVVHGHNLDAAALVYMREAKKAGRFLIAHAHNTNERGNAVRRIGISAVHKIIRRYPDYFYACSTEAAQFAFGNDIVRSRCEILYNGISLENYCVDQNVHDAKKRAMFPGEQGPIFGTVGRLVRQKNQSFLLDVFAEVIKREPSALLVIAGKGPLKQDLEEQARALRIDGRVKFVGSVPNVPDYLKAFDAFVFPSIYEGLGMAAVEAQAAGLPTLISSAVPSLALCSDLGISLSLESGAAHWADVALDMYEKNKGARHDRIDQVRKAGFDVSDVAKKLSAMYSRAISGMAE